MKSGPHLAHHEKQNYKPTKKYHLLNQYVLQKRCSRRAPAREQNNEHTQSEQLHGSASEQQAREQLHGSVSKQQTEVLRSNVSSGDASKCHFGPIVTQKLKEHFEKDPYPCHATKEGLAQELGLTFNQISKWFSATRHYSRVAVAKNQKYPGENTTENNSSAIFDGIQVIEPNFGLIDKPDADTNDMISEKLMVQINLNEGIEEDIPPSQYTTRCEEKLTMTQAAISREAGPPGNDPGENFLQVSSMITSCEQSVIMAPSAIARGVGPPGYTPGEHQGNGAPWNTSYERRPFTSPATSSREDFVHVWHPHNQNVGATGSGLSSVATVSSTLGVLRAYSPNSTSASSSNLSTVHMGGLTCITQPTTELGSEDTVIAQFLSNPAQVGPSESPVLFSGTVGAASTFSPLASNDLPVSVTTVSTNEISAMVPPPSTSADRLGSTLPEPLNTGDALERYKQVAQKFFTSKIMKNICDLDKTPGPGRQLLFVFSELFGNAVPFVFSELCGIAYTL
ncbi:Homeobox protein HAZ1 [Zea mays]|uniref:Homeobox protein HAZ1 n=1 Tax=Zea mays TaxID=4577 RepID=A0A3L6F1C2_MAIZE|nr:Homeobox protein HAZ1 [Zea mays]